MSKVQEEGAAILGMVVLAVLMVAVMAIQIHQQQAFAAQSNNCGNGFGTNHVNCQNLGSQIQGNGNAHTHALVHVIVFMAGILATGASHLGGGGIP